ncbi:MAG: FmdE family protein [bacterium]
MSIQYSIEDIQTKSIEFHGHFCPGLAIGIKVSEIALEFIGNRSMDEEIVAVVENDSCAIDAIQIITGCTLGKGNLIIKNYGKHVYTFFKRQSSKCIRISLKNTALYSEIEDKQIKAYTLISKAPLELFHITSGNIQPPPKAQILKSEECDLCHEPVKENKLIRFGNNRLCIPCKREIKKVYDPLSIIQPEISH